MNPQLKMNVYKYWVQLYMIEGNWNNIFVIAISIVLSETTGCTAAYQLVQLQA